MSTHWDARCAPKEDVVAKVLALHFHPDGSVRNSIRVVEAMLGPGCSRGRIHGILDELGLVNKSKQERAEVLRGLQR